MLKINQIGKQLFGILLFVCFYLFAAPDSTFAEFASIHGFAEEAFALRVSEGQLTKHDSFNMAETRLQLKGAYIFSSDDIFSRWQSVFRYKGDFIADAYFGGKTDFQMREASFSFRPANFLDIKLGRQVLTWGTGDYLFINDVFPKDYVSFYIGRDDEYLKKPSDAIKLSFYPKAVNVDFVVMPIFEPNTLPGGDRLAFFDSFRQGIAGRNSDRDLLEPAVQAENFEYAARFYRNFGSTEAAVYLFRGFDKMPRSYKSEANRQLYYQRQDVFGASLRGPFMGGIANIEGGYLRSPEDPEGDNRLIENSMFKLLAGYEKDLGNDLKLGLQYYYEQKLDYSDYADSLMPGDFIWDKHRHLLTQRLTKLFRNQTVAVVFFNFYSPSDRDGYVRFSVSYDLTDQWKLVAGINMPWGEDEHTDFSQMKKNKNIYFRLRYSF